MWGTWFGITMSGLAMVLLLIGVGYGIKSGTGGRSLDASKRPDPVRDAAPASGEGSLPPSTPGK